MQTKMQRLQTLRAQLFSERSTFMSHYRELGENILPRRPRFMVSDVNKGDRRNSKIIDATPTLACRTLAAGMMGGVTSPARRWFRLTTPDPDLAEFGKVKEWLHIVAERMSTVFMRSNLYNTLPQLYGDIGTFATSPMSLEEDFRNTIHTQSFPVGSYMIAKDYSGRVNVFVRDFRMTVRQLVEKFGRKDDGTGKPDWSIFSERVKNAYEQGMYETWIDVCHVISPNAEFDPNKTSSKYKRFMSCYFELSSREDRYLRESGYDYFPILCPRWQVTGEDVYGTDCPGMTALGDIKALQLMHKRKQQAIEKMINPPMKGPTSLRGQKASILPGDMTYTDERDGQRGFAPVHEINFRIGELKEEIQEHQQRIKRAFFEDLFLMLAESDRRQITATEIDERKEEKLLALGPVLEQLNQDLLDPMIDNTFNIMLRQSDFKLGTGPIPKPPDEIRGQDLRVEYISIMANAQKLIGVSSLEKYMGFIQTAYSVDQSSILRTDMGELISAYGDYVSVPPKVVRTADQENELRQQQAQAAQAQQKMEMFNQGAQTAHTLSQTNTQEPSALSDLLAHAKAGQIAPGLA